MIDAAAQGERTVLDAARPDHRRYALILAITGLACVVIDLAAPWHSLSPVTMVGFLLWFAMAGFLVAPRVAVVSADATGVRVGAHQQTPWSAVHTVVLVRRDVLGPAGAQPRVFLVLASAQVTDLTPLGPALHEDPRVLLAQVLPPALDGLDAAQLATRLRTFRPELVVVDHRG